MNFGEIELDLVKRPHDREGGERQIAAKKRRSARNLAHAREKTKTSKRNAQTTYTCADTMHIPRGAAGKIGTSVRITHRHVPASNAGKSIPPINIYYPFRNYLVVQKYVVLFKDRINPPSPVFTLASLYPARVV